MTKWRHSIIIPLTGTSRRCKSANMIVSAVPVSLFLQNQKFTCKICLFCPDSSAMGVKMLQCFPFYRRCKERCKNKQCPPVAGERNYHQTTKCVYDLGLIPDYSIAGPTSPIEETKPRLSSTTSWSSDSDGAGSLSRNSQIYFSSKARLSFRHQMDSNVNAVDATY